MSVSHFATKRCPLPPFLPANGRLDPQAAGAAKTEHSDGADQQQCATWFWNRHQEDIVPCVG
jgi:hypothetical protein